MANHSTKLHNKTQTLVPASLSRKNCSNNLENQTKTTLKVVVDEASEMEVKKTTRCV